MITSCLKTRSYWKGNSEKRDKKKPAKNSSHFSSMKQDELVETLLKETAGQEKLALTDEREDEVKYFFQKWFVAKSAVLSVESHWNSRSYFKIGEYLPDSNPLLSNLSKWYFCVYGICSICSNQSHSWSRLESWR